MSPASNARRVTIREWSGLLAFLGSLALAACGSGGSGSTPCQSNADCPAERICQGATCQAVGISIASPSDGTATNGTLQVQLAVAGAGGGTAALVLDGAPLATLSPPYSYAWDTHAVAEGAHTLKASLAVGATTYESTAVNVLVDRKAPAAPAIDPLVCSASADSIQLTGTAEANAAVTIYEGAAALAHAAVNGGGKWVVTTALSKGPHTLTARAQDAAGNVSGSSDELPLAVDDTLSPVPPAPTVNTTLPPYTNALDLPISVSSNIAGVIRFYLDDKPATRNGLPVEFQACVSCSHRLDLPNEGTHVFTATQTSTLGCPSPASPAQTFVVDRKRPDAPSVTSVTPAWPSTVNIDDQDAFTSVAISGNSEPNATITVFRIGGQALGSDVKADASGAWSMVVNLKGASDSPTSSRERVVVQAYDLAWNGSYATDLGTTLWDRIRPAAPLITNPNPWPTVINASMPATLTVSGTAEANATVRLFNGSSQLGNDAQANANNAWSITVGPLADGNYNVTAAAWDVAGNQSANVTTVGTTLWDRTPPTLVSFSANAVLGVVTVTASFSDASSPPVTITLKDGATQLGPSMDSPLTWTGSLSKGPHTLTADAMDKAGNTTSASLPFNMP